MSFNFKKALEEVKTFQTTSEGKAEEFLRTTINTIKTSIDVNRIEKLCFEIYGEGDKKNPACYKLFSYYYYRVGGMLRSEKICFSNPFFDRDEILLVYDTIKNKLKKEGFEPEEALPSFGGNDYYHLIKGLIFKV